MLAVSRFSVGEPDAERFLAEAREALSVLAGRPGFRRGQIGRAVEDPASWLVATEWDGVGAYRRALSAYEVKVGAVPLLARSDPEPSAFEVLVTQDGTGTDVVSGGDRARDAGTAAPRRRARPAGDRTTQENA